MYVDLGTGEVIPQADGREELEPNYAMLAIEPVEMIGLSWSTSSGCGKVSTRQVTDTGTVAEQNDTVEPD